MKPSPKILVEAADCVYSVCPPSLDQFTKVFQNETMVIYAHNYLQQLVISFRGTQPTSLNNIYYDILQGWSATGLDQLKSTERYQKDLEIIRNYVRQYSHYKIYFTGHSLGGALAQQALRDIQSEAAMVFNSAYQSQDSLLAHEKVTRYHIKGDPLIALAEKVGLGKKIKILPNKGYLKRKGLAYASALINPVAAPLLLMRNRLKAHRMNNFKNLSLSWN